MIIVLFGAPGVGKGTQAEILAQKLNVEHLSTGAAFRTAIAEQTPMGLQAKEFVDNGILVSDDVVAKIVEETLARPEFAAGCILDGFPRTKVQAEALSDMLLRMNRSIASVVNITVPDVIIVERLLARGRNDDREDVIRHRLSIYANETEPLLDYYQAAGVLRSVDGLGTVDAVNQRILDALPM
jgi:adenylate kinase